MIPVKAGTGVERYAVAGPLQRRLCDDVWLVFSRSGTLMRGVMLSIGAMLAALAVGGAGYVWWQTSQFEAGITSAVAAVREASAPAADLPALPPIVSAFALRNGGVVGHSGATHLKHRAKLTIDRTREPIDIAAEQWLSPVEPAMAWVGHGSMAGLPVTVIDSVTGGRGRLEARLLGTITVAGGSGADFDKGELQRYLSELPVHPNAILNNAALSWRQIDATTVEVTARSATGPASATFSFDAAGDITGMVADDRPMSVGTGTVPTAWIGSYSDYREMGGYRIPAHGEVGWQLEDGIFTYWRGDIVAYETTPER